MLPLSAGKEQEHRWHKLDDRILSLGDDLQAVWVLHRLTQHAGLSG